MEHRPVVSAKRCAKSSAQTFFGMGKHVPENVCHEGGSMRLNNQQTSVRVYSSARGE
jgi:hypothetical protein